MVSHSWPILNLRCVFFFPFLSAHFYEVKKIVSNSNLQHKASFFMKIAQFDFIGFFSLGLILVFQSLLLLIKLLNSADFIEILG